MSNTVKVLKDEHSQAPIPSAWRSTLFAVVEAFKDGDFRLVGGVPGVRPISAENAERIATNIQSYGALLTRLPEDTWQTSACQWMRGYWDVLVDLYTIAEGASDLALAVRVYEEGLGYAFEVQSVHVP
jgi:hypothetical protein